MKRQNLGVVLFVVFSAVVSVWLLMKSGIFSSRHHATEAVESEEKPATSETDQDKMGQPASAATESPATTEATDKPAEPNEAGSLEDQRNFSFIISDMQDCLDVKGSQPPEAIPLKADYVVNLMSSDVGGSPPNVSDRWMNWHLRTKEGLERRLRLEVTDNDEGRMVRELHWYAVDREGLPVPLELESSKRYNPNDETINQMLHEGEVFFKEKAAVAIYDSGDRVDFIERNGELTELEVLKGDRFFRCSSLKNRESCQCVR